VNIGIEGTMLEPPSSAGWPHLHEYNLPFPCYAKFDRRVIAAV